jgi:hypothetical protein
MFHTALYLADMDGFLHYAAERAPQRGELAVVGPLEEIRLDEAVYRYPGKDTPAVAGGSLRRDPMGSEDHRGELPGRRSAWHAAGLDRPERSRT